MSCRPDSTNGWRYRLCPDAPPREADRTRGILRWLAVDEITNSSPDIDYTISAIPPGLSARVGRDGVMGLVGNPLRTFPILGGAAVPLSCQLAAPGYLPQHLDGTLGPFVGFPDVFVPKDLGPVALHRTPIVIRGRVVQLGGVDPTPVPNVPLWLAGVWSTFPAPNVASDAPNLVSLHPGLYGRRQHAVDGLRRRDLVLTSGQDKTLVKPAVRGEHTVRVSDQIGIAVGGVIAFDPGRADRVEYLPVKKIVGLSTPDQPATLTLEHRLALDHDEGSTVVVATPQAPSPDNLITRDGIPGDIVAFATLGGVSDGVVVELSGGPSPVEYQTARLHRTVSDADGFYRFPPISRLAMVQLHADQAPAQEPVVTLDYQRYENLVDVVYP